MNTAYLMLKTAYELYGQGPAQLAQPELERVRKLAANQFDLEALVLSTPEARDVTVPQASLAAALEEIRGRYASEEELRQDLERNGLSLDDFAESLARELRVEGVLEKVGSRAAQVSDIDVELYYHYHPEQFQRPETRAARHILVTLNDDIVDNTRPVAMQRLQAIAARLEKDASRFEEQAMKHSECPSALKGGVLGEMKRGQLYPELDAVLFELQPGQVSGIVESPIGLHLVRCDSVTEAGTLPLAQVKSAIRELLMGRRKRICQGAWLKQLRQRAAEAEQRNAA